MQDRITIATRNSPLALWQAEFVAQSLRERYSELEVELLPLTTRGDQLLERPLAQIGGKALFLKELQRAILAGDADIAVHSMKDVPAEVPQDLEIVAVTAREEPADAFVSNHFASLAELPRGARVGTCSLRRQAQLLAWRNDLRILPLRGNVNTRLGKLDAGDYDAIVLACAGLLRLGFGQRIRERIGYDTCLPAIGQGIMGIETRKGDTAVTETVRVLNDSGAALCLSAERAFGERLQASCQVPLAAHASEQAGRLSMDALVAAPDGSIVLRRQREAAAEDAGLLGRALAESLLEQGADRILSELPH